MTINRKILIPLLFLIVTFIYPINGCATHDQKIQKLADELHSLSDIKNFDDLSVKIYYYLPWYLPRERFTARELTEAIPTILYRLEGDEVDGKLDMFGKINEYDLVLDNKRHPELTRFYIVIESLENGKLLEMKLFGGFSSYTINGVNVRANEKILDAVLPLLESHVLSSFEVYRDRDCYCD